MKKILPELRFPEFKDAGEWIEIPIANVLIESRIPSNVNDPNKRITVRLNQKGIEKREVRGTEAENATYFFVRRKKQFIYGKQNLYKGAFGIIPDELDGFESSQDLPAFDFKKGFSPEYFVYYLGQEYIFPSLEKISTGTGSKRIQPKEFFKVQFPFPKLPEQQCIAACLSSLDELISAHSQKLELLKTHKKGLMQNMFPQEGKKVPKLRFKEFEKDGEWEHPILSKVSDVIMGSSPSSTSYNEDRIGLPLLQGNADIKNRLSAPRIYTTEITKECEVGDILLSVRAPVGTVAKSIHNACIGRGISALRAKKPNSQEYLYQWLFSYESSWGKISQGGTFDAVNSDDVRNLLVPIPSPKEQQKIASCLSSLDELITAQSKKIEQLKQHKKGLMQGLFPKLKN